MQRGRIEICTVRPYEGVRIRVYPDSLEHAEIAKGAEQLSAQDGSEIDLSLCSVIESNVQHERTDDSERDNAVEGVIHLDLAHRNGSILSGARPACRSCQSVANSA